MFKKKDNHNIPKGYDRTIEKSIQPAKQVSLVGGAASKAPKIRRFSFKGNKKAYLVIVFLLVAILSASVVTLLRKDDNIEPSDTSRAEYVKEIEAVSAKVEADARSLVSGGVPATNNNDELTDYYTKLIWVKLNDGDPKAVAEYYVEEIKPKGLVFTTDINEAIVAALLQSEFSSEAKPLVASIIKDYNNSEFKDDPVLGENVAAKIKYYTELEGTL